MDVSGPGDERRREEIACWFGPWARPRPEGDGTLGGVVELRIGATREAPGVERGPGGFRLTTEAYELRVARSAGREDAVVLCAEAGVLPAARTALRILACRRVVTDGGLALHASSARSGGGLFVFAGPSGAGKTSAAGAFPEGCRLDPDLVLLAREGGRWFRIDMFDEYVPARFAPGEGAGLEVRAVLVPAAGRAFGLERLAGSEAVRACLHLPVASEPAAGEAGLPDAGSVLARVEALALSVPVARMTWALGEDLPALLDRALGA